MLQKIQNITMSGLLLLSVTAHGNASPRFMLGKLVTTFKISKSQLLCESSNAFQNGMGLTGDAVREWVTLKILKTNAYPDLQNHHEFTYSRYYPTNDYEAPEFHWCDKLQDLHKVEVATTFYRLIHGQPADKDCWLEDEEVVQLRFEGLDEVVDASRKSRSADQSFCKK